MSRVNKIEISILKGENRSELNSRLQAAVDEENRLAQLLTDEDSGSTPELRAVQEIKNQLADEMMQPMNYEEITYLRGYSFIDVFFNPDKMLYGVEFEITQEQIGQFVTNCNLIIENPEVCESILPINPSFETPKFAEDDVYHEHPIYYDEEYLTKVTNARDLFNQLLTDTHWDEECIFIQIIG